MSKKLVLVIAVLAGLAIASIFILRERRDKPGDRIAISGNIELTEVNIAFKSSGQLTEITVAEGGQVKKGMVLARLDREQLLHQLAREKAALTAARSQLTQLNTSIQYQREFIAGEIDQRQADLQQAQARLEELKAGSRPQEIREAQSAVEAARTEYERARKDWERAQILHKNNDISTSQFDQFRTRYESAAASLKQSEERLALVREGPRKQTVAAAGAEVARAKAGVRLGEASRIDLKRRQEEAPARRAEIERARAQVALIESQLEDTVALSPIDGVVLVKAAEAGEVVAPGTTILTVGDIEHPWLRGYISERDLGRVRLGDKARITTDSYPGKVYWGRVSFISPKAEFTPKQIQTKEERVKLVYRIKIEIDNLAHELKSNMPADADIVLVQASLPVRVYARIRTTHAAMLAPR